MNRFLLSAWSDYFTTIFTGIGYERPEVKIENVNAEDLSALIDYCSTGKLFLKSRLLSLLSLKRLIIIILN